MMRDRSKSLWGIGCTAACLLPFALGCQVDELDSVDVGETAQAIIGGFNVAGETEWEFVPMLSLGGGTCTGTLVAPTIVLSAAHCVEGVSSGRAYFGLGGGNGFYDDVRVIDIATHRAYSGFKEKDIALLRLERQPDDVNGDPMEPVRFNLDALDQSWIDYPITTVGFGHNIAPTGGDPSTGTGSGTQRQVESKILGVTAEHLLVGTMDQNTCQGDSGGPTFAKIDGEWVVMAVTSFGTFNCLGQSNLARTDVYQDDFLLETMAAWSGPCAQDNSCNDSGECQFLDPDCDVCGYDGICGLDCESVDLDCPLGGLAGDRCEDQYDCESRVCITATDDPRVKYCSEECDPNQLAAEQCDIPLSSCVNTEGANYCTFTGPTPGTQGAACTNPDDCLGACDPNHAICVEACNSDDDCGDEWECSRVSGTKVCTVPEDGGCRTGGKSSNLAWIALALLGMLATRRRRR